MASNDRSHPSYNWRSRHRKAAHNAAHEESHSKPAHKVPDLPGLFRGEAELIDDPKKARHVIDAIRASGTFAFDTEFIGESSYRPQTCLVQLATREGLWLVDPINEVDVTPFFELVVDPALRTIVHAGEQDLEQVWRITGKVPANVFDAQIAAGFVSMSYPASLAKLILETTGVKLNKGFTFTDWTVRPLSASQLRYAADDVRYLLLAAQKLDEMLAPRERTRWVREECEERCHRLAVAFDPETAWERVRGSAGLDPRGINIVKQLVAWRDASARRADVPPRTLVKDECLIDMARSPARTIDKLRTIKHLPRPIIDEQGEAILAAISRGTSVPVVKAARSENEEPTLTDKFRWDALWSKAQMICYELGLDPALVTSRQEIVELDRTRKPSRLMTGWRNDAIGQRIREMLGEK